MAALPPLACSPANMRRRVSYLCENATPRSPYSLDRRDIPASIAMNVAQAIVHHKSSALTLTVVQNGSSKSLQFKRDWPTNSSDLVH